MCGYLAARAASERRLVGALLLLVVLERLERVDVAERGCFGATSSQPGGWTPKRLTRMAISERAFIGPMPGRSSRRRSRSWPSRLPTRRARRRRRSRSRSPRRAPGRALGHRAGEAVSAGSARKARSSSPGSMPAISLRRVEPMRRFSSSGPRRPSGAGPAGRARTRSGAREAPLPRSSSASSFPVKWSLSGRVVATNSILRRGRTVHIGTHTRAFPPTLEAGGGRGAPIKSPSQAHRRR